MKKVLITSKSFGQSGAGAVRVLTEAGCELIYYNDYFDEKEFKEKLSECDGLIIGSHKLSEDAVKAAGRLKIVSKHGTGLDNIDLEMMKRYGINVKNVPAVNANSVADLTFGLILDTARKISLAAGGVSSGKWKYQIGVDVYKKTISLIGFGKIGQKVAKRARGFSMEILAYDPYLEKLPDGFNGFVELRAFEEALEKADFLSIHVPLNDSTKNLISLNEMKKMKRSAIIINTSRGGIVNEADLAKALSEGIIAGAGLDVLEEEPVKKDNPLVSLDCVTITPHMGMYTTETINRVSVIAAQNIVDHI